MDNQIYIGRVILGLIFFANSIIFLIISILNPDEKFYIGVGPACVVNIVLIITFMIDSGISFSISPQTHTLCDIESPLVYGIINGIAQSIFYSLIPSIIIGGVSHLFQFDILPNILTVFAIYTVISVFILSAWMGLYDITKRNDCEYNDTIVHMKSRMNKVFYVLLTFVSIIYVIAGPITRLTDKSNI